jgi:hypothetical protein
VLYVNSYMFIQFVHSKSFDLEIDKLT